jgi:hypothetical protein
MKNIAFILLIVIVGSHARAQQDNFPKKESHGKTKYKKYTRRPVFFIGLSTGLNNNTGLIGVSGEIPVASHFSVEGGAGISSWGTKLTASCKYYLGDNFNGWAFGAGMTYNTGLSNFHDNLETIYGTTETVTLNLHVQANVFAAAYKYWRLGKGANRIYIELGYSVPVTSGPKFDQTSGDPISGSSTNVINFIAPHGLVAGFGFSFGIH